jgi:hypothetical protein
MLLRIWGSSNIRRQVWQKLCDNFWQGIHQTGPVSCARLLSSANPTRRACAPSTTDRARRCNKGVQFRSVWVGLFSAAATATAEEESGDGRGHGGRGGAGAAAGGGGQGEGQGQGRPPPLGDSLRFRRPRHHEHPPRLRRPAGGLGCHCHHPSSPLPPSLSYTYTHSGPNPPHTPLDMASTRWDRCVPSLLVLRGAADSGDQLSREFRIPYQAPRYILASIHSGSFSTLRVLTTRVYLLHRVLVSMMLYRRRSWGFRTERTRSSSDTRYSLFSATVSPHPWCLQWCYWYDGDPCSGYPLRLVWICGPVDLFICNPVQASKKSLDPVAPLHKYGVVSISNILTTTCQYEVGLVSALLVLLPLCCFVLLCKVPFSRPSSMSASLSKHSPNVPRWYLSW